ncbi:phosphoribosyltransferase-like protein [Flagellimonas beolgyonensis]|uniref:phosphoribosyltransferase-like protein n=1 Tax=Flagellimonas beolgyonensis TaxID=864064 RepID=UPI003D64D867
MKRIKKEDYNQIINLYIRQNWLISKQDELLELVDFCDKRESKELVFSLLDRFNYLNNDTLLILLNNMCDYIIEHAKFDSKKSQILAMTYDDEADSGQKVLDLIKLPLFQKEWKGFKTVNKIGKSGKYYKNGRTQIVLIDEFIGSGKTLKGRINYLEKNIPGEFEIISCFIAGTKETIHKLEREGYNIFCALQLDKGISEYYKNDELNKAEDLMLDLELKLAQWINDKELYQYSFGFGNAEALYTMEGCNGNTPNSVFPIFWWLFDVNKKKRNTLLTRYENGF